LAVVDNRHANPYRNLINAVDADVRLSIVGGLALYGDEDMMTALKGDDHEPAGRYGKVLDVTFLAAPDGAQTWASITENLTVAMRFNVEEMTAAFGDASDFASMTSGMTEVGLDPWYTYGDARYFSVLNGSGTANAQINMALLYDRYYDRAETLPEVVSFEDVEATTVNPCSDGTSPPCTDDDEEEGNTSETNQSNQETEPIDEGSDTSSGTTNTPSDNAQGDEEDVERNALLLLGAIVAVMLVALFLVSRGSEDALAAEVRIEKMWDEEPLTEEANDGVFGNAPFVPAPPPMSPPREEE